MGKTVLLNEFERTADQRGFFHHHIEVEEDGRLPGRIASALRMVLLQMDARRRIGARARHALGVVKAFSIKLPDGPEFGIDIEAISGPADTGDLAEDLAGLFVEMGRLAHEHEHFYGDTSALNVPTRSYAFKTILRDEVVRRKLVHGSDWPILCLPTRRAGWLRSLRLLRTRRRLPSASTIS